MTLLIGRLFNELRTQLYINYIFLVFLQKQIQDETKIFHTNRVENLQHISMDFETHSLQCFFLLILASNCRLILIPLFLLVLELSRSAKTQNSATLVGTFQISV